MLEAGVVLQAKGICMTFPGVKALDDVTLTLKKGEIRALMGENGAGKSTLIKCLTGVNKFEAGEIYLEGFDKPIVNRVPGRRRCQHPGNRGQRRRFRSNRTYQRLQCCG